VPVWVRVPVLVWVLALVPVLAWVLVPGLGLGLGPVGHSL